MTQQNYTFTVVDHNGEVLGTGLSAVEAMDLILTDDGYAYEIRAAGDGAGFELWHSDGSAASTRGARHMVKTVAWSSETDEAAARDEIARKVIAARWPRLPEAMTDATYQAMLAELAEDAE